MKELIPFLFDLLWQTSQFYVVDFWNNQPGRESEEHPLQLPACYVELDVTWENISNIHQKGEVEIRLHIIQEQYSDSYLSNYRPQDDAQLLSLLDRPEKVYQAIQGKRGAAFNSLRRTSQSFPSDFDNVHETVLGFRCEVTEAIPVNPPNWPTISPTPTYSKNILPD